MLEIEIPPIKAGGALKVTFGSDKEYKLGRKIGLFESGSIIKQQAFAGNINPHNFIITY